jgi:RNA polymerase sigma-70 factor (ECF subfamily)
MPRDPDDLDESLAAFFDAGRSDASGCNEQFAELFDEVYPGLCRFLECLIGRSGAAPEIAQESFLRLFRTGLDVVPRSEARFWLYRVARNLAMNELSRRATQNKFRDRVASLFRPSERRPEESIAAAEQNRELIGLLEKLPEDQRAALLLREQDEMSYSEIARVLNVSESKVKVDIHRARCRLREGWNALTRAVAGQPKKSIGGR